MPALMIKRRKDTALGLRRPGEGGRKQCQHSSLGRQVKITICNNENSLLQIYGKCIVETCLKQPPRRSAGVTRNRMNANVIGPSSTVRNVLTCKPVEAGMAIVLVAIAGGNSRIAAAPSGGIRYLPTLVNASGWVDVTGQTGFCPFLGHRGRAQHRAAATAKRYIRTTESCHHVIRASVEWNSLGASNLLNI